MSKRINKAIGLPLGGSCRQRRLRENAVLSINVTHLRWLPPPLRGPPPSRMEAQWVFELCFPTKVGGVATQYHNQPNTSSSKRRPCVSRVKKMW